MTKDPSELSREQLGKLYPVKVVDYDPSWIHCFEKERETLLSLLRKTGVTRVEHFGSTAVVGLAAKPTIDMLVELPEGSRENVIKIMKNNGYREMENHPTHTMFVKGYHPHGYDDICYHIHMGTARESQLWERLLFRDYLSQHPVTANEYASLKRRLAREHEFDREAYTEAKTGFIQSVTARAKACATESACS